MDLFDEIEDIKNKASKPKAVKNIVDKTQDVDKLIKTTAPLKSATEKPKFTRKSNKVNKKNSKDYKSQHLNSVPVEFYEMYKTFCELRKKKGLPVIKIETYFINTALLKIKTDCNRMLNDVKKVREDLKK